MDFDVRFWTKSESWMIPFVGPNSLSLQQGPKFDSAERKEFFAHKNLHNGWHQFFRNLNKRHPLSDTKAYDVIYNLKKENLQARYDTKRVS